MTLKHSRNNKSTFTHLIDTAKLINSLFSQPILPESKYMYDKFFNSHEDCTFHAVCSNCFYYFGKAFEVEKSMTCPNCNKVTNAFNLSNPSFFVMIDPSKQISEMLQLHENYYYYVVNERVHKEGVFSDIYDGVLYRKFLSNLSEHDRRNYATGVFSTDGAAAFSTAEYSVWPSYTTVDELPPPFRQKHVAVCGLYFGRRKPEVNVILKPWALNMRQLSEKGFKCTIRNEERNITFFPLVCCPDAMARHDLSGSKQCNGFCGCDWLVLSTNNFASKNSLTELVFNFDDFSKAFHISLPPVIYV